jgi:hypothetical protein
MVFFVALSLFFLALIVAGLVVSIAYSALLVYKVFSKSSEEESMSLLDAAKISATKISTPVFGEYEWFALAGSAVFLLFCRAGWQNFSKAVLQMHWTQDDDQVDLLIYFVLSNGHQLTRTMRMHRI